MSEIMPELSGKLFNYNYKITMGILSSKQTNRKFIGQWFESRQSASGRNNAF